MNWKNWPYWVRGGIVGFVITLALYGTLLVTTNDVAPPICYYDGGWEMIGKRCSATEFFIVNYKEEVIVVTVFFAILGYLYGKYKNRKSYS